MWYLCFITTFMAISQCCEKVCGLIMNYYLREFGIKFYYHLLDRYLSKTTILSCSKLFFSFTACASHMQLLLILMLLMNLNRLVLQWKKWGNQMLIQPMYDMGCHHKIWIHLMECVCCLRCWTFFKKAILRIGSMR